MRNRGPNPYVSLKRHSLRMELVLEFEEAIPTGRAAEVARRLLERLELAAGTPEQGPECAEARLVCHDTRQVVALRTRPEKAE